MRSILLLLTILFFAIAQPAHAGRLMKRSVRSHSIFGVSSRNAVRGPRSVSAFSGVKSKSGNFYGAGKFRAGVITGVRGASTMIGRGIFR